MKKNLIIPLFVALAISAVAADKSQPPVTMAVYDFTDTDRGTDGYGAKVTTLVTADLTTETNLVMLERAELNKALKEQAFGVSGMVSSDAAAKIGQITGAKVLVAGQVFKTSDDHVVIVANIIGTETARLYAAKVEGSPNELMNLTSELARNIAQTISDQRTNLVAATEESHAERLDRIVKSIKGKNRPTVSVSIVFLNPTSKNHIAAAEDEFGAILLKAGFMVVDENSDQKPDMEITGIASYDSGIPHGGLYSPRGVIDLKVQERRTGKIITFDRQESAATDPSKKTAIRAAQANAVDALAERVLPLLAQ